MDTDGSRCDCRRPELDILMVPWDIFSFHWYVFVVGRIVGIATDVGMRVRDSFWTIDLSRLKLLNFRMFFVVRLLGFGLQRHASIVRTAGLCHCRLSMCLMKYRVGPSSLWMKFLNELLLKNLGVRSLAHVSGATVASGASTPCCQFESKGGDAADRCAWDR